MSFFDNFLPGFVAALLANLLVGGLVYWMIARRLNADLETENRLLRDVENQNRQVGYLEFLHDEVLRLVELSQSGLEIEKYHPESDEPYDFNSYHWEMLLATGQIPYLLDNDLLFRLIRFYKVVRFIQGKAGEREKLNYLPRGSQAEVKRLQGLQRKLTIMINHAMADMVESGKELPDEIQAAIKKAKARSRKSEDNLTLTHKRRLR